MQQIDSADNPCHTIDSPELCKNLINKFDFKVLTLNIRSIHKNFDSFLVLLARLSLDIDVIVLTECWLNDDSIVPQVGGYTSHRTTKYINKSGGVVVFVKNIWKPEVMEPDFNDANCLCLNMNKQLTLFAIYRSPSFKNTDPFLDSLEHNVRNINNSACKVVVGDININICPNIDKDSSMRYLCLLAELGLVPLVTIPTRNLSCLDHVNVTAKLNAESVICKSDLTDHDVIVTGVGTKQAKPADKKSIIRKLDYRKIEADLSKVDWSVVTSMSSLDDTVASFTSTITRIMDTHTKLVTVSRSKAVLQPWMTPGLLRCSKHKDALHARSRKKPNDVSARIIYTRYRNFYIKLLRKLKGEYEANNIEQNKTNPRKLWNCIRNITNTKKNKIKSTELLNSTESEQESLNRCNEYFTNVGPDLAKRIMTQTKESQVSLARKTKLRCSPSASFFFHPTDESEIERAIMDLKSDSAPGLDGVTNILLKKIKNHIVVPLTLICNRSISEGVFPEAWKVAVVTPVHKGGIKDNCSNYRPISLLGSLSKILERIVNKRLQNFLEERNILSNNQFGFRRAKSTEDAVSVLTEIVSGHLDQKRVCVGAFLDLAKAFDTVSIPILIEKLEQSGIRGAPLNWIQSYLLNRKQCVKVDGHLSGLRETTFGVPQGSILGPTLFLLYVNDLASFQLVDANILCYADDTAVIFHGKSWDLVSAAAGRGLARIADWLQNNLLTLNADKTKFLCFHKTLASAPDSLVEIMIHSCPSNDGSAACNCSKIERASSIKYLGVVLDEKLTFIDHITSTAKRVRRLIYVFRNLRSVVTRKLLKTIYVALAQPIISYCIPVWGGAARTHMIHLERAQRSLLKVMHSKPRRYPTFALYEMSEVLTVRQLYVLRSTVIAHKAILALPNYKELLKKRTFICPLPKVLTRFAKRLGPYIHFHIYKKVNYHCNIKACSLREVKLNVQNWLSTLNYDETENLLI